MKTLKLLTLAFIALSAGFTGCKKDEKVDNPQAKIVGQWAVKTEVFKGYIDGKLTDEDTNTDFGSEDYLDIKSDGKITSYEVGDTDDGTYTIDKDNKKLTVKWEGSTDTDIYEIQKLTADELILYIEYIEVDQNQTFKDTFQITFRTM